MLTAKVLGASGGGLAYVDNGYALTTGATTVWTATGLTYGGSGTRIVAVMVLQSYAATETSFSISSVTIGGVTATTAIKSGGVAPRGIFYIETSETSGDVVITYSANNIDTGTTAVPVVYSISILGADSATPVWTGSASSGFSSSSTKTLTSSFSDAALVWAGYHTAGVSPSPGSVTWTGLPEEYEVSQGSYLSSTASTSSTSAGTIQVTCSDPITAQPGIIGAAWQ